MWSLPTVAKANVVAAGSRLGRRIPVERGRSETRERKEGKKKWKKERKRRVRRSHNPRVVLKSVAREPGRLRLRSVPRNVQQARKRAGELKEKLKGAKEAWGKPSFRHR